MDRIDVVRIEAEGSCGVGFVVGRDRLLTALHVIGDADGGELSLHAKLTLELARLDGGGRLMSRPHHVSRSEVIAFDRELDWALLAVEPELLAGITVWELGDDTSFAMHDEWAAYGFPDGVPPGGLGATGTISSKRASVRVGSEARPLVQLHSLELGKGTGVAAPGYSGGPVIVGGKAVALLCAAMRDQDRSERAILYAVPLAMIAPRLGLPTRGLLPLPDAIGYPPSPFRGLHRYRRGDARVLFGRNRDLQAVIGAVEQARLLCPLLS